MGLIITRIALALCGLCTVATLVATPRAHADRMSVPDMADDSWVTTCGVWSDNTPSVTGALAIADAISEWYGVSRHTALLVEHVQVSRHCPEYLPYAKRAEGNTSGTNA
jgi:hypothetical protein